MPRLPVNCKGVRAALSETGRRLMPQLTGIAGMTEHIRIESDDGVLCMTMNRPQKKNALTPDMYAAMTAALEQAAGSDAVRAVLITGTGDSYTAGNDITSFQQTSGERSSGAMGFGDRL